MRVTIDTNVFVSALVFGGAPGEVLDLHTDGAFVLCISPVIIAELRRVLAERFEWSAEDLGAVVGPILSRAEIVEPVRQVWASSDPDDNHVLACALEGRADFIVTGDRDLLVLGTFEGIPILTVRRFLDRVRT